MRDIPSVDASCGYYPTDLGRLADADETCDCQDLLVVDGAFRCRECGTVYGVVYGFSRFPRRAWRAQRRG
jgi:hypothetical protein